MKITKISHVHCYDQFRFQINKNSAIWKKIIIWSEFKIFLYAQISRTFVHRKSNMDVQTYISKYIRLHTQYRFNGFVSGRNLIKKYRNIFLDL